jgi:hypothetical protein
MMGMMVSDDGVTMRVMVVVMIAILLAVMKEMSDTSWTSQRPQL